MNCLKNQRERFTTTESWSPPAHVAYNPLRVSRSQSSPHSLDNSRFSVDCRSLPAAGGFFSLEDDNNDYLLDEVPMESTVHCLCKCGHEVSYPGRSRPFLGYLPEVEEEIGIPFTRELPGSSTAPLDAKLCYAYTRPESNLEFIYSNPSSLGLETSRGLSYFSTNADADFQRPEKEILVNSSLSRSTLGQTGHRDERRMLLSTPEKFRCINKESSDIYNRGISVDQMNAVRNLPYEGIQSPGYEVQFRNRQGAFVPVRPKQAMSNSPSEVPSSSSVSVSSDESEHPGSIHNSKSGYTRPSSADPGKKPVSVDMEPSARSSELQLSLHVHTEFAHGNDDLRPVPRHPKYKTELCRSFTDTGLCSYGKRCRFVHSSSAPMQALPRSSDLLLEKTSSRRLSIFQQLCGAGEKPPRQP